ATLSVSSERPCRNHSPSSSIDAQSPCTQTPGQRDLWVAMYLSGSPQMPRVIPGHGFVHTSSPTPPRSGSPSGPKTSTAIPSAGPPSEHAFNDITGVGERKHARTSVPPEKLMTGQRPPPTRSWNHMYGSWFHGSPVEPRMRSDDRSC